MERLSSHRSRRLLPQGIDDGGQSCALRAGGIEKAVARCALGETAELHQGTNVLATRQAMIHRTMTKEQAAELAFADQGVELGRGDVEQEADEDPDMDGNELDDNATLRTVKILRGVSLCKDRMQNSVFSD